MEPWQNDMSVVPIFRQLILLACLTIPRFWDLAYNVIPSTNVDGQLWFELLIWVLYLMELGKTVEPLFICHIDLEEISHWSFVWVTKEVSPLNIGTMPIQTSNKFSGPSSWLVLRERGGQLEIGVETTKKTILWLPEVRKFPFQHCWPLPFLMQQIYYQRSKCSLAFFCYFIFPQNHEYLVSWKAAQTNCSSTDYPFQSSGDMPHWVTAPVTCGQMGLCHSALFYLAGKYLYVGSTRSHFPWE